MRDRVAPAEPGAAQCLFSSIGGIAIGAALGAGLMFLLDPANGYRRRAAARRLFTQWRSRGDEPRESPGIGERSRNLAAAVRARLQRHHSDGRTLEAKVRARIGRVATNPGAIAVIADGNRVTLRGAVPPDELDDVLDEVAAVDGVREVYNLLQVQLAAPFISGQN
ncbi:MAG TPA: BON domain-containing protein [Thermoanaerobaculia bacterium]|nr:BON domain-containing protein [Thermoanaerobaculia bacterium]